MSLRTQIASAIAAHGQWKERLRNAIETGSSEFNPETVQTDNQCDFGKWLYGTEISEEFKNSTDYQAIKELHARFHQEAAGILDMALQGKKEEAENSMKVGSEYFMISSKLTAELMKLSNSTSN